MDIQIQVGLSHGDRGDRNDELSRSRFEIQFFVKIQMTGQLGGLTDEGKAY